MEITKKNNGFAIIFSEAEAKQLGIDHKKEHELSKAKDGIWILTEGQAKKNPAIPEKKKETTPIDEAEQKIIGLLKKFSLSERVEGSFEKQLSKDELKKFSEMISQNKIEKFKLNESYKKAVYKLAEENPNKFDNDEKPFHEFTLENDGFLVVKNENRAKELSEQLKEKIKEGEIKGTRNFNGEFYVISTDFLENAEEKVLKELKGKMNENIEQLSAATGLTQTLCKIAIEFLKEEGQVIERRKKQYQYIE